MRISFNHLTKNVDLVQSDEKANDFKEISFSDFVNSIAYDKAINESLTAIVTEKEFFDCNSKLCEIISEYGSAYDSACEGCFSFYYFGDYKVVTDNWHCVWGIDEYLNAGY